MFKQYAVEPKGLVGSGERAFAAFWHLIGHTKGRFIVEYPRTPDVGWFRLLAQAIKESDLSPKERKKIEAKIFRNGLPTKNKMNNVEIKIVKGRIRSWDSKKDWIENVKREKATSPLDGIISHEYIDASGDFLLMEDVDEDHPLLKSSRTPRVARSGSWIGKQVGVLFEDANSLSLVDSYFDPRELRWKAFLNGFLNNEWILQRYGRGLNQIRFHCDIKVSRKKGYDFKSVVISNRKQLIPKGVSVEFCLWDKVRKSQDSLRKEEMHPRAIFSDQVGLSIDWGLDESREYDTICGVLDEETHKDFILKFETQDPKFEPLCRFSVTA